MNIEPLYMVTNGAMWVGFSTIIGTWFDSSSRDEGCLLSRETADKVRRIMNSRYGSDEWRVVEFTGRVIDEKEVAT